MDGHKHKKVRIKKSSVWRTISLVLAALLIISVLTNGFSIRSGIDSVASDIDKLIAAETSESVKTQLTDIRDRLLSLAQAEQTPEPAGTGDTVKLDFYVMSQCPFGTQVEDAIKPVLDQIGAYVDFNLDFIATDSGDGTFRALHGEPEVKGNIVQLCAIKYNPDKYMEMIVCQNKNAPQIPDNWEQCAQDNGLDVEAIRTCYEGGEGKELLRASIKETDKVGATGSPTIYLNDERYNGGRQTTDFLRAICDELSEKPEPCVNLPEPAKVNAIVLNDERCKDCDTSTLTGQLKSMFPGLQIENLDYSDSKGKKLFDELDLKLLPAILFDSSVEEADGYSSVQRYLQPVGDYRSLRIGASFDPAAEVCDNEIDDTGNGLVDCDDPTCQSTLECREEIPKKLDLFVMSQCPFGTKALDAMREVLENFEDIDFGIHFIATDSGDGTFRSLHGQPEVDENIRELCVMKYYPDDYKYMDYIWCRDKNIQSTDWEPCAKEAGMSAAMIKTCSEGEEGKELLRENIKLTNELDIGASPTWLANNRAQFSGIDSETVRKNYCEANPGLAGCETTLSSGTGGVPAGNC